MLSQSALHQPITGSGSNDLPSGNAVKTVPMKEPAEFQKNEEGGGIDLSSSLA